MGKSILNVVVTGDSMWPSIIDGDKLQFVEIDSTPLNVGDIILFKHPFKSNIDCIKRIKLINEGKLFVEGDNPDPLASEDSHNFGWIKTSSVDAVLPK